MIKSDSFIIPIILIVSSVVIMTVMILTISSEILIVWLLKLILLLITVLIILIICLAMIPVILISRLIILIIWMSLNIVIYILSILSLVIIPLIIIYIPLTPLIVVSFSMESFLWIWVFILLLLIVIIILLKFFKSSFLTNLGHSLESSIHQSWVHIIIVLNISITIIELIISVLSKIIYWIKGSIYFKNIFHNFNSCFTLKLSSIYMINRIIFNLPFWNLYVLQKVCNMFLELRIIKMNKKDITFINFNL